MLRDVDTHSLVDDKVGMRIAVVGNIVLNLNAITYTRYATEVDWQRRLCDCWDVHLECLALSHTIRCHITI